MSTVVALNQELSQSPKASLYLLPSDELEKERLILQHHLLKQTFGRLLLPKISEYIKPGDKILDCGTGTGIWCLELAEQLSGIGVTIQGIDLTARLFPSQFAIQSAPNELSFSVNSVLSLPTEWTDSFDVVQQRLLIVAFPTLGWLQAVGEIYRVLKPGGWVQLIEVDPRIYPSGPAHEKVLELAKALFDINGCLWDCVDRISGFLESAGFEIAATQKIGARMGKWAADHGGVEVARNYTGFYQALTPRLLEAGIINTKEEYKTLLIEMEEEWNTMSSEVGGKCQYWWTAIAARKPLKVVSP